MGAIKMKNYILLIGLSFLLCFLFTPLSKKLGQIMKILDLPNENKIHKKIIPRSGGIAIYLSLWLTYFLYSLNLDYQIISLFISSTAIFLLGLSDDRFNLKPLIKLIIEFAIFYYFCISFKLSHPFIFSLLLILFVNSFNLIDGLNGLAILISFISCFAILFLVSNKVFIFYPILIGISSAFFFYNMRKNYIFMGDGGSLFLGFMIGVGIISYLNYNFRVGNFLLSFLIFSIPLIETFVTVIRRLFRGKNIFSPDLDHIYNLMVRKGIKERKVVLIYFLADLFLVIFALVIRGLYI
jgi:UDP-GlcNAc:undecaprenyl-phosphate GlcNAc-1-phosphate transferase